MKKLRGLPERNSRMLLYAFLGILLVTLAAVSIGSSSMIRGILYRNATEILDEFSYYFEAELDAGVRLSAQITNDLLLQELASYSAQDSLSVNRNMNHLQSYSITNKELASLYVYNGLQKKVYLSARIPGNDSLIVPVEQLSDSAVIDCIREYAKYPVYTPIPRRARFADGSESFYYTIIGYNPYMNISKSGRLNSAVIVNLSIDWINRLTPDSLSDGSFLIVDEHNRAISSGKDFSFLQDLSACGFVRSADAKYQIEKIGGVRYFITGTAPNEYGWHYYWFLPYSSVTAQIGSLWMLSAALGVVLTLVSFVVIRMLSKSINGPILDIQEDLAITRSHLIRMQSDKESQKEQARQDYLLRLLSRDIEPDPARLREKLKELSVSLPFDAPIHLFLLRAADRRGFLSANKPDERTRLLADLMRGIRDAAGASFFVECFHPALSCQIAVLLSPKSRLAPDRDSLLLCARNLCLLGEKLLIQKLCCCVAGPVIGFGELARAYAEAQETDRYQVLQAQPAILFCSDFAGRPNVSEYPEATEHRLTDALTKGDFLSARRQYRLMLDSILPNAYPSINIAFARLALSINILLNRQRANLPNAAEVPETFDFALENAQSLDGINASFFEIMHAITDAIAQNRSEKNEQLIRQIDALIAEGFHSFDFCIERIASEVGMSADYVSRLYRQQKNETLLTSIIRARMDFACERLSDSDEPVSAIAAAAGYASISYFYRSFKKEIGVTPAEYRAAAQARRANNH